MESRLELIFVVRQALFGCDLADAGLFSFSIDNCEDLEVAKREVGDRMRFAGNVPPIEVMKDGSIDDVIEACKDCLRKMWRQSKRLHFEYRMSASDRYTEEKC